MENVWETASEVNVSDFNVQRSIDGITFETIGKVNAKGAGKYSLTAPPPPKGGIEYFRLEVVDKNGAISYSEVKEIQLGINNYELRISPNPANDYITISGVNVKEVRINDVSGRILLVGRDKRVDVRGIATGIYYLTIEGIDGVRVVRKFVKK